jgi:hypothetical protein
MDLAECGEKITGMLDNFQMIYLMDLEHNRIKRVIR